MSLVAPLYLAALAALALPWLLHRFSDARPEERPFPSARFLEPSVPPVSRKRRLRHRALFALRALALLALALLFAEPWIARPAVLGDARSLHVVAIDTSLSMRAGARFERALEAARERLAAVPEGEPVQLVAFALDVTLVSGSPGTAAAASAALGRLEPGYAAADYGRLMQRLDRLADEAKLPVRATLVSDAQRSALPERRNALYAPRLAALDIVDVAADEADVSLAASATSVDGAQARIVASVAASASGTIDDAALDRVVVVSHDGETLARERVRLAPGERASVVFENVALPDVPEPRFEVGFDTPDALPEDDAVRVAVRRDGARRVALAALGTRVSPNAEVFVTTALEADGGAVVDTASLASGQLPEDFREVVLFTPLGEGAALPSDLRRFVARGGGALVVDAGRRSGEDGGPDMDPGGDLGGGVDGAPGGVAPSGGVGGTRDAAAIAGALRGSGVGRVDETHPLALGDIDWGDTRFFTLGGYVPEDGDRVLIETEERAPVLIERPSDNGLLLILDERLDGIDSSLPFQPAFVALMRRIVEWFDAGRAVPERVLAGDSVALPVNVQVLDPDGRALIPLADTASARSLRLDTPGLYTVVGALGEQSLAVVLDPRESDLRTVDAAELAAWSARHAPRREDAPDDVSAAGAAVPAAGEPLALWPFLLPLLATLLLGETLYANRRLDVRRDGT